MAFKKLCDYTTDERFNGKDTAIAQLALAYRKATMVHGFNLLTFCAPSDISPEAVDGAELVKLSFIDELSGAQRRKIGVEGTPLNVVRKTELIEMDALNSTFQIDRRQLKGRESSLVINDNMNDATLSCCQAVMLNLFKGRKGADLNWNGLDYYFESGNSLSGMSIEAPKAVVGGVVDQASALQFGSHLRKVINAFGVNKPNVVFTTSKGLELIQAYNQVTNVGIKYINVNDVLYTDFMGLTTCDLPESYFDATQLEKGIPFYFVRFAADKSGCVFVTKTGEVFDPIVPDMSKNDGRVYNGSNEIVTALAPLTTECAGRCFVTVE